MDSLDFPLTLNMEFRLRTPQEAISMAKMFRSIAVELQKTHSHQAEQFEACAAELEERSEGEEWKR